jgi:hypothetical protein
MSFIENGVSFLGHGIQKDHQVVHPVMPIENPLMPEKFSPILSRVFDNPLRPEIEPLTEHANLPLWESPEAVTYIFANLKDLYVSDLEKILRTQQLVTRIGGNALKDKETMATVISTTGHFDEEFDNKLASLDPFRKDGTWNCKYYYTKRTIEQLNGLSQNPSFHEFLNQSVGYDTKPAFEELRNHQRSAHH